MKKQLGVLSIVVLVAVILTAPLVANSHRFRLAEKARLYAIDLEPGEYVLKVYDDVASIYQGKKLIGVARIEIEPIAGVLKNSTLCCDGVLREIRLEEERVLIVEPTGTSHAGE